jgi:phage repressor protein C with HTH and peptisase S24 domain
VKLFPFSRFIVADKSMMPAFKPGDHVLTFNWIKPAIGDVVVFRKGSKDFIKRIDKIENGQVFVSGDNKKESAKFGSISQKEIIGKVVLKY